MAAMPPPIADERADLCQHIAAQHYAFHAVAFKLTDEQARATPTVSALSIGALIKHVTGCQRSWMQRVAAAPEMTDGDKRPMEEQAGRLPQDEFVMREDETLADILAKFDEQNAETILGSSTTVGSGRRGPRSPAACAVVPEGHSGLVGTVGPVPHDRGTGAPCRAGRHHPRNHRRRNALRTAGRP